MGKPVVMGRKTWDSLPRKPLPGRRNIVITRQPGFAAEGAEVAATPEEALRLCGGAPEMAVIGGGEVYRLFWPHGGPHLPHGSRPRRRGRYAFSGSRSGGMARGGARVPPAGAERDTASFTLRVLDRMTKN